MAQEVQAVRIETTASNNYATIIRSCITGCNAAKRLGNDELASTFINIKRIADENYDVLITGGNPSLG